MTSRHATDNTKAPNAFLAAKREIDGMRALLKTLNDSHFDTPDEIHWGDVGTLNHYCSLLCQITDSTFNEGEHAE